MVVLDHADPTVPQRFVAYSEEKAIYTLGEVKTKPFAATAVTGAEVLLLLACLVMY